MATITTTYEDVAAALERRAAIPETVTYNNFAREVGLPPVNNLFANSALAAFFQQIDAWDSIEQRPFRTALVVKKSTQRPGAGFFKSLRELRKIDDAIDDETLWTKEISALAEYYRTPNSPLIIQITPAQRKRLDRLCDGRETTPASVLERSLTEHIAYLEELFASIDESRSQIPDKTISHEELFKQINDKLKAR